VKRKVNRSQQQNQEGHEESKRRPDRTAVDKYQRMSEITPRKRTEWQNSEQPRNRDESPLSKTRLESA